MRKILLAGIVSGCLFTACSSADSSTENISYDSSIVRHTETAIQTTDSSAVVQPAQNIIQTLPATVTAPATTISANPTAVTNTATTATAPGMNPPHGQPGHRCDIAVGAPLNSPPGKNAAASTTQPMAINSTATPPAPAKTAPGMNPPHGQPGHRCDIAVGAPLNSAPAKPITTTTNTETKTAEAVPASINVDTAKKQ